VTKESEKPKRGAPQRRGLNNSKFADIRAALGGARDTP
jgi:hypothetical protein